MIYREVRLSFESRAEMETASYQIESTSDYTTWEKPEVDALTIKGIDESDAKSFAKAFNAGLEGYDEINDEWEDIELD